MKKGLGCCSFGNTVVCSRDGDGYGYGYGYGTKTLRLENGGGWGRMQ